MGGHGEEKQDDQEKFGWLQVLLGVPETCTCVPVIVLLGVDSNLYSLACQDI